MTHNTNQPFEKHLNPLRILVFSEGYILDPKMIRTSPGSTLVKDII
jgi:hypothetical protein